MEATEQYFPVVLFIMLYKVIPTFESEDEILKCYHSNESYWAVLSCGTVYYAVQGGANVPVCRWNSKVWRFKWKLLSGTFLWYCLLCCTRWFYKLLSIFKWAIHIKARDKSDPSRAIPLCYWAEVTSKYCALVSVQCWSMIKTMNTQLQIRIRTEHFAMVILIGSCITARFKSE